MRRTVSAFEEIMIHQEKKSYIQITTEQGRMREHRGRGRGAHLQLRGGEAVWRGWCVVTEADGNRGPLGEQNIMDRVTEVGKGTVVSRPEWLRCRQKLPHKVKRQFRRVQEGVARRWALGWHRGTFYQSCVDTCLVQ